MISLFDNPFANITISQYIYVTRVPNTSVIQSSPFLYSVVSSLKVITMSSFFNLHTITALLLQSVLLIASMVSLDMLLERRMVSGSGYTNVSRLCLARITMYGLSVLLAGAWQYIPVVATFVHIRCVDWAAVMVV